MHTKLHCNNELLSVVYVPHHVMLVSSLMTRPSE